MEQQIFTNEVILSWLQYYAKNTTLDLEHVPFQLAIVMTPTLCTLLSDYTVQEMYVNWLDKLILLGENQINSLEKTDAIYPLVEAELNRVKKCKDDFVNVYKSDLLSAFRYYADRGSLPRLRRDFIPIVSFLA